MIKKATGEIYKRLDAIIDARLSGTHNLNNELEFILEYDFLWNTIYSKVGDKYYRVTATLGGFRLEKTTRDQFNLFLNMYAKQN